MRSGLTLLSLLRQILIMKMDSVQHLKGFADENQFKGGL
jgi:hypothetical protein